MAPSRSIHVAVILLVYMSFMSLVIAQSNPALAYRSLQHKYEIALANHAELAAKAAKMVSTAESLHRFAEGGRRNREQR
jgi:hypothetical protein